VLVDTHAHLYLEQFADDEAEVLARARQAGVTHVILPAIDVPSIHAALAMCDRHPGMVFAMAAIHPSAVKTATEEDLAEVERLLQDQRVVAVGESGLDYYWDRSYIDKQRDFLRRHAELAIDHDLPLVLHNRDQAGSEATSRDLVATLSEAKRAHPEGRRLRGVFHCFGPPRWLAQEVMDLGLHVGIGGTITYKNSGVAEAIAEVPLDRIVLETDSPYLAPAPHRGKRNEPAYMRLVAEALATARGMSLDELAYATTAAARKLFALPEPPPTSAR
jgi:TatD DNase family protein